MRELNQLGHLCKREDRAWTELAHIGRAALIDLVKKHAETKMAPTYAPPGLQVSDIFD